jgi:hypothetical protein
LDSRFDISGFDDYYVEIEVVMEEIVKEIELLFDSEVSTSQASQRIIIGSLTEELVDFIFEKTNLQIDISYKFTIDKSGINHSLKRHGNEEKETKQGMIAVTKDDFLKIPQILAFPDEIEYDGKSRKGLEMIFFKKKFDNLTVVVQELRTGKKELAFLSMYKFKNKGSELM